MTPFKIEGTAQEILDKVSRHLLTQWKRSRDDGRCAHRTPDGLSCAVGCLLPDDVANACDRASQPTINCLIRGGVIECPHEKLLKRLQELHDATPLHLWRSGLDHIAREFGLDFTPPAQESK